MNARCEKAFRFLNLGLLIGALRVKKVLSWAAQEAKALNHAYVGTEHILLGLLREGDGGVGRVLANLDLHHAEIRQEILKELDPNWSGNQL